MVDYSNQFESYLINKREVSDNTLQSYMRDVRQFFSYCSSKAFKSTADITTEIIRKYLESLQTAGRSESTIIRSLATIRCYYQFLCAENGLTQNPANTIKALKKEQKMPQILNSDEIELLLNQPDVSEAKGCRDKAMLELLYATGIRVSELINLDLIDVNFQVGILHCKNSKNERIIPIYADAQNAIQNYISHVRSMLLLDYSEKALFVNMNGTRLTRQGFWKIVKHYTIQAKIKKDITPHTLRHSFAAHLLENGAQLKDIKEMMGHSDISSTQIYAQIIKNKYKDVYSNFHPKARTS